MDLLISLLVNFLISKEIVLISRPYMLAKYYEFSFFPRTATAWNELPSDTISAQNLDMLKQIIFNTHHIFPYYYSHSAMF